MSTAAVTTLDLRVIESVLEMSGGYVLDFSNRTFSSFLREHGVDIDDQRFAVEGSSKAKRLRCFLRTSPAPLCGRVLAGLLQHRLVCRPDGLQATDLEKYRKLLARLIDPLAECTVSEVTRRSILDELRVGNLNWAGRLSEADFLSRLYDLDALASHDPRFKSLANDIWQHRERNSDWPDDWVFTDSRFDLLHAPDDVFLRFLCQMVHPVVRPEESEAIALVTAFNGHLTSDRWQIVPTGRISAKHVYSAQGRTGSRIELPKSRAPKDVLSDEYIQELAEKSDARLGTSDFDGAITIARTMLEAVLVELELRLAGARGDHKGDLPRQFKQVARLLKMDDERPDLDDRFKDVIRGLVMVANGLAPLRNKMSDGHARERKPAPHHARVVVNAAKTVAAFLVESYYFQHQKQLTRSAVSSAIHTESKSTVRR